MAPPPFRAEHVGSLMRPADLLTARSAAGVTSSYSRLTENVQVVTEKAIAEVVAKQLELGIRPITSGEYERNIFYSGFFENLQGMESLGVPTRDSVVAVDRIKHTESPYLSEWKSVRARVPQEQWKDCKLTMPPITHSHMQMAVGTAYLSNVYSSDQEYFKDLAEAYTVEFRVLYNEGLRSIQIDDPCLLFFVTDEFRSGCVADGVDPDELLDQYIWAHNQCLLGKPVDLHVGLHLCRGNMTGSLHIMSGSYECIAKKIFTELAYDTYYLEYDTERAGDFEPLHHLPIGKDVILGIVSTKSPELEDLDELVARVNSAAEVIARGQGRSVDEVLETTLGVSPQCGFASMSSGGGSGMTMDIMWEKLLLIERLAKRVWV